MEAGTDVEASERWPTPWRVEKDTNVVSANYPEDGERAVIVEATPTVEHAYLIAASHDLHDALEDAVTALESLADDAENEDATDVDLADWIVNDLRNRRIPELREALEKAEV